MEDIRNLKTADLSVRESLNSGERDWVVRCLLARVGVEAVATGEDAQRLAIQYDADRVCGMDLLDILQNCGVNATPSRLPTSAARSAG